MKFASVLRNSAEELPDLADLFALYKQLKKSLKRIPGRGPDDVDHSEASQDTQPSWPSGAPGGAPAAQQQQRQQQEEGQPQGQQAAAPGRAPEGAAPAAEPAQQLLQPAEPAPAAPEPAAAGGEQGEQEPPRSPAAQEAAATALDEQEEAFLRTITEDVQKLNDSYIEKEELNVIKLGTLEEKVGAGRLAAPVALCCFCFFCGRAAP